MKRIINNISIWYTNRKNGVKILSDSEYEEWVEKNMGKIKVIVL